jgi:hypothetical protein
MKIIPFIRLKKKKMINGDFDNIDDFFKKSNENKLIYIFDLDGIERNKPNLCTYQKMSITYELWVDSGPRTLGDVVDAFMAGSAAITIRKNLYPKLDMASIREITENKIFINIDLEEQDEYRILDNFFNAADGIVNLTSKEKITTNFKYGDFLKSMKMKNKIYSYEVDSNNVSYWKGFGVEGLLIDINKLEEFKHHDF